MHTIFITWLVLVIHGLVREPKHAWVEQLYLGAAVFICLPILNAVTTDIHLINTLPLPGRSGDFALAGVDLWFLIIGFGLAYAGRVSSRKESKAKVLRKPKTQHSSAVPAE